MIGESDDPALPSGPSKPNLDERRLPATVLGKGLDQSLSCHQALPLVPATTPSVRRWASGQHNEACKLTASPGDLLVPRLRPGIGTSYTSTRFVGGSYVAAPKSAVTARNYGEPRSVSE